MNILKRIEEIRKTRNLSIYELAKKSGIPNNTIYRWYANNYTPTLDKLQLVCEKGFNMSLLEFFADKEDLIPATTETKELISMWSSLNQVQKDTIIQLIKSYKK